MINEKQKKRLKKVEHEIYIEMFKKATPPADFDKLIKNTLEPNWYNRFYLNAFAQQKIIDLVCMKHKLSHEDRSFLGRTIRFGYCPATKEVKFNPYARRFVGIKKVK